MGTHYKGTKKEIRALDAFIKLVRAADSVTARITKDLGDNDLTVSQFGVLEALLHLGPMHQREIGKKILKSSGNITMVIDNLEKRGLVKRERKVDDRRFITVYLTNKGRWLIGKVFPHHLSSIVEEMNRLTKAEQEELGRLCKKLGLKERE